MADTRLGGWLGRDEAQQAQPGRVGDGLERGREFLGVLIPQAASQDRRTAPGAPSLDRHGWILTEVDGSCNGIDIDR
jgi:hypothetical protein